jgi:hypothetical protein
LTSEYSLDPVQDWSLSYLVSYTAFNFIDIGLGISFARLFSVDEAKTTSTDPNSNASVNYVKINGDTGYVSFQGTKPMARLALDPKALLPDIVSDLMGKNDLRLYGEICVSGWKDYKNYDTSASSNGNFYDKRSDRTLIMFGLNIPAFRALDVFSLEFEHFPNRYPNSYKNVYDFNAPKPLTAIDRNSTPWKWSLYAKKTFLKNVAIIGQIARDHFVFTNSNLKYQMKEDVLTRPGDWWWVLRLNVTY